jgi:hypothetical protein
MRFFPINHEINWTYLFIITSILLTGDILHKIAEIVIKVFYCQSNLATVSPHNIQ